MDLLHTKAMAVSDSRVWIVSCKLMNISVINKGINDQVDLKEQGSAKGGACKGCSPKQLILMLRDRLVDHL